MIRDLKGTVQRERAAMGLLFTLEEPGPQSPVRKEAATAGFYRSPTDGRQYPRIVIYTVRELLDGRLPDIPSRYGVQEAIWTLPTASRAARTRPLRPQVVHADPSRREPAPLDTRVADERRADYAHRFSGGAVDEAAPSPEALQSRKRSTSSPRRWQPSEE